MKRRPTNQYPREEEVSAAIEAELRPGGRPTATYNELHAIRELSPVRGATLTTRIVRNLEDRIVAIEEHLGLSEEAKS